MRGFRSAGAAGVVVGRRAGGGGALRRRVLAAAAAASAAGASAAAVGATRPSTGHPAAVAAVCATASSSMASSAAASSSARALQRSVRRTLSSATVAAASAATTAATSATAAAAASAAAATAKKDVLLDPRFCLRDGADALAQVDAALGRSQPPAVELILVNPAWTRWWSAFFPGGSHSAGNVYGHSAVRYRLPDDAAPEDAGGPGAAAVAEAVEAAELASAAAVAAAAAASDDSSVGANSDDGAGSGRSTSASCAGAASASTTTSLPPLPRDDLVFNVVGAPDAERMIWFLPSSLYFFGAPAIQAPLGGEQGGVHLRSMTTVRVEEASPAVIRKLHAYFGGLAARERAGEVGYALAFARLHAWLNRTFPRVFKRERANCARWTSAGLQGAGLLRRASSFPKLALVQFFAEHVALDPANVNVVHYKSRVAEQPTGGMVAPLQWWSSFRYWTLERSFANAVVSVDDTTAAVRVSVTEPLWKSAVVSWREQVQRWTGLGGGSAGGGGDDDDKGSEEGRKRRWRGEQGGAALSARSLSAVLDAADQEEEDQRMREFIADYRVLLLVKSSCGHCRRARRALEGAGIPYSVVDLEALPGDHGSRLQRIAASVTGQTTVPNVFVGGNHVGGASDTLDELRSGAFQKRCNTADQL